MSVRITILTDNQIDRGDGLAAEHGLSLLVEAESSKVLLDAGQTDLCLRNAAKLGLGLGDLQAVILSHGHYDHGGGILPLLEKTGALEVIAHPDAFGCKFARRSNQKEAYIGLSYDVKELTQKGAVVKLNPEAWEISRNLLATGPIPRVIGYEGADRSFFTKTDGKSQPDHLNDDQALVIRTPKGLVVLLGCAHSGVINTLRHAINLTNDDRICALVGGLHLAGAGWERIRQTVLTLHSMKIGQIVACHCTGFPARMALQNSFGEQFTNGSVGGTFTF